VNETGVHLKRQEAKGGATYEMCPYPASVWGEVSGKMRPSFAPRTVDEIRAKFEQDKLTNEKWGRTVEIRPFSIGDYEGLMLESTMRYLRGGWSGDGYRDSGVEAFGHAFVTKGGRTIEFTYSVGSGGCWDNSQRAFQESQAAAARAEAQAILAGIRLSETPALVQVPYTGPKLDGSDLPVVHLRPEKIPVLKVGEMFTIEAVVENAKPEDSPFSYEWTGAHGNADDQKSAAATILADAPGKHSVAVSVGGARHHLGSAALEYTVADYKVHVERVPVDAGPNSVGTKVGFVARLVIDGQPAQGDFIYRWQPHPEVSFNKLDAQSPDVSALFVKPGAVGVWVEVLEKRGETLVTVAESDQIQIEVVAPELSLTFEPQDPLVGQEVKAKVVAKPDVTEMDLRWMPLPLNAHQGVLSENGRELSMYLKDDKPVQVTVMARVPVSGEALGMAQGSIGARKYAVNVTGPKAMGPPPQVWKEGVGLVTEEKAIAVHQIVEFSVAMQPEVTTGALTYQWKVQSGGCSISNPTSRDARVTASEAGTCELVVGVRDKNGVELGTGQGAFSASVTQDMINQGKQKAKNVEEAKAQSAKAKATKGDYDGAISDAESAVSLDPANSEAKSLAQRLRQEKETMDRQMAKAKALMVENRFADARKEFIIASNISSSYPPVQEFDLELKNKQSKYEQEVRRKIDEVRNLNEKKEFAKAVDIATAWRATTKLDATADKELKIQEDWASKWQSIKDKQLALIKAGMDKARSGDFAGAMQDFDAGFANQNNIFHGQEVEVVEARKLQSEAAQKQKRLNEILTQVGQVVAKGNGLSSQGGQDALILVDEGLKLQPANQKLGAWKSQLTDMVTKASAKEQAPTSASDRPTGELQADSSGQAQKLWAEAEALQKEQKHAEAIAKYKEGLAIAPSQVIADRVKKLEKYLGLAYTQSGQNASTSATVQSSSSPIDSRTKTHLPAEGFSGEWETDWKGMRLEVRQSTVIGSYEHDQGKINGVLSADGRTLTGTWSEAPSYKPPQDGGRIEFVLGQDGNTFSGRWSYGQEPLSGSWNGRRKGEQQTEGGKSSDGAPCVPLQPLGGDAVNLALGKPATQSSTYAGTGVDQGPHHAVDGKTSGQDPHDLIHTNYEAKPWWRVDLGVDAAIQRIRIHNRTNPEVKANLSLELLVSQDGRNWTSVYEHDRTVFTVLDLPVAVSGRHVMARLNSDHDALQLYEIEVWGHMTGGAAASEKVGAGTDAVPLPPVSESSSSVDATTLATSAAFPAGWRNEQVGNVSFAVPSSWGVVTENEPEVEMLHLHWDGDFDSPLHGISTGIALDWARAKAELPGGRVVRLGGVDVVRYDDGPAINLLFPEMSGNRGVLMVVFQGPGGNQGVIESVLQTIRVGSGEGDQDPSPLSPSGTPEVSFEVGNIYGVYNGPTQPTVFTLNVPRVLALIQNYHWNSARGATPGTISLQDAGGRTYGPWQAEGSPGQGGVPNAYWTARPMVLLPAGTYTVIDSDPASWAQNSESGGRGFTRVETLPAK
jgi:tetratricopeptide (TPR) repeat protein